MKKFLATAAIVVGGIGLSAADAFAGIEFLGWEDGGSWYSNWTVDSNDIGVTFDRFRVTIDNSINLMSDPWIVTPAASNPTTMSDFNPPSVIDNFSVGTWTQGGAAVVSATASDVGNDLALLTFRLHHGPAAAVASDGVKMRITLFNGGWTVGDMVGYGVMAAKATSATTTFKYTDLSAGAVPLPPAAWSGLAMIGAIGAFVVKRRRDRAVL